MSAFVDVVLFAGLLVAICGVVWGFAAKVVALAEAMHRTPDLDAIHGREEAA